MCKTIELRDQIALEAMKLALADSAFYDADHVAKTSYALADAMMKARQPEISVELKVTDSRGAAYDGIGLTAVEYAQGWRSWDGAGVPPAKPEEMVAVRLRDLKVIPKPRKCENWNWDHNRLSSDIVAYRVVKP